MFARQRAGLTRTLPPRHPHFHHAQNRRQQSRGNPAEKPHRTGGAPPHPRGDQSRGAARSRRGEQAPAREETMGDPPLRPRAAVAQGRLCRLGRADSGNRESGHDSGSRLPRRLRFQHHQARPAPARQDHWRGARERAGEAFQGSGALGENQDPLSSCFARTTGFRRSSRPVRRRGGRPIHPRCGGRCPPAFPGSQSPLPQVREGGCFTFFSAAPRKPIP